MKLSLLGLAAAVLALSSSLPRAPGDAVRYAFRNAPINARGVASLADLRGKPVLIDFWGTR